LDGRAQVPGDGAGVEFGGDGFFLVMMGTAPANRSNVDTSTRQ